MISDWKRVRDDWKQANAPTPPVLINVCNETTQAAFLETIMRQNLFGMEMPSDLKSDKTLLRIDSKIIDSIESGETKISDTKTSLREKVRTVGKVGLPGEDITNIISVNMLTEGWDVQTVSHIMGLRTFGSQLLCEQVVGRGLRRVSYDTEEIDGKQMFTPEYVTVLGVPFGLSSKKKPTVRRKPTTLISLIPENYKHQISWPVIDDIVKLQEYSLKLTLENKLPYVSTDEEQKKNWN